MIKKSKKILGQYLKMSRRLIIVSFIVSVILIGIAAISLWTMLKDPSSVTEASKVMIPPSYLKNRQINSSWSISSEALAEKLSIASLFGFSENDGPQVRNDPVLGETFYWIASKRNLIISEKSIDYQNDNTQRVKNPSLIEAEIVSINFLKDKNLEVGNLSKKGDLEYYQFNNNDLKLVSDKKLADVVKVILEDKDSEKEVATILITGAGEVWRMIYQY